MAGLRLSGLGLRVSSGGGGSSALITPAVLNVLPDTTGVVGQLFSGLKGGVVAWTKLSGSPIVSISSSGAISLSTAMAEGTAVTATFRAAIAGIGLAIESTITISANTVIVVGPPAFNPSLNFGEPRNSQYTTLLRNF